MIRLLPQSNIIGEGYYEKEAMCITCRNKGEDLATLNAAKLQQKSFYRE